MEDGIEGSSEDQIRVQPADCPRIGREYRVRAGDTPDSRWLVHGDATVLLNDSAAEIISRCDGRHSVASLIQELGQVYVGAPEAEIADGVTAFLELALSKGWLEIDRP